MTDGSRNNLKFIGETLPYRRIEPERTEQIFRSLMMMGIFSSKKNADTAIDSARFMIGAFERIAANGGDFALAMYLINYFTRAIKMIQQQYPNIPEVARTRRASV